MGNSTKRIAVEVWSLPGPPPEPLELVCEPCADYVPDFRVCVHLYTGFPVRIYQQRYLTAGMPGRTVSFRQESEVYRDEWTAL